MVTWKPQEEKYGGGSSAFGADFAKGEPAIAKQLCDASGQFEDKKTVTVNGYSYKVKIVPKKDGTGNWIFIERKQVLGDERPETTAHNATLKEYSQNGDYEKRQSEIRQAHADNQKMHTEMVAALKEQTAAMLALANELQGIKHLFEIAVNNSDVVKKTFTSAANLVKESQK